MDGPKLSAGRTAMRLLVVLLAVLTLHVWGPGGPGTAQAAGAWEFGQSRDFTPPTPRAPTIGTRSITPILKLSRTVVQRPRVAPGDVAALLAEYEVSAPGGTLDVRETRVIQFDGQQLARLERKVSRPSGLAGSEVQLKVPLDAAPGWYSVTTTVEPLSAAGTRSMASDGDKASSAFYVGAAPSTPAAPPTAGSGPVQVRLWSNKTKYRVGDTVKILFESSRDGYVTLVNLGTSGQITILYPNSFSSNQALRAGQTYSVPGAGEQYELTLNGPEGVELVYALFTTTPTHFAATSFTRGAFPSPNTRAEVLTRDINVEEKKVPLKDRANAVLELDVAR